MSSGNSLGMKEAVVAASIAAGVAYSLKSMSDYSKKRLPPGPKSLPFIGHMLSVPRSSEHLAFAAMGKQLNSDIIALTAMGQTIVVLNSAEAASELLDKKSSVYSGRAQIPAVSDKDIAFGATLLHSTYGYLPTSPNDDWIVAASAATDHIAQAAQPTRPSADFIVNFFPALRHLPDWFPGTGWKRILRSWREHKEYITAAPYNWTKEQIQLVQASTVVIISYPDFEVSKGAYAGGLDTSIATASFFILAMVLYPEVALKIQEEADRVLGNAERFPTVHDREQMPYVRSTLLEVLRWQPVNPLAIPHAAMDDDEYKGYQIPKGSIVMGNTWAITRDERIYPDPECFNPDRFLDPKVPSSPAFGYGRRICPGSHFADANLFLLISTLMYIFDIERAVDEKGEEIIPEIKTTLDSTVSRKPQSFSFVLKPRSEAHMKLAMGFNE
ncbi:unnamed protein product [Rhizoctonia solani]|uniref:O-methylsterigmatocystin oxidoreductase n=1 Tax=Rhizoctonia solani TaxID=456999 RepID=A0A8H2X6B3_9AGAM|nr:unnamed protein product [Rhizoctonia solani]